MYENSPGVFCLLTAVFCIHQVRWAQGCSVQKSSVTKQKFIKMPRPKENEPYKKLYTERDLQKCLRDIQNGKYFFLYGLAQINIVRKKNIIQPNLL
jgi:hypothetical protein